MLYLIPSYTVSLLLSLFLSLSTLKPVSSAPASPPLQPSLLLLELPNGNTNTSTFLAPSTFLELPSNANANSTTPLTAIENWTYVIPHTTLLLRMAGYPPHTIPRSALGRTILSAQTRIRAHLKAHGDGELGAGDDPFETPTHLTGRCFIGIASSHSISSASDVKLTYETLLVILQGLWEFMYRGGHECEVVFKVEDKARERRREGEELVGVGKVLREGFGGVI